MKLVVSFHGMCLCVLEGRRGNRARSATVLLLNGAAPSTKAEARASGPSRLPFHHYAKFFLMSPAAMLSFKQREPVPFASFISIEFFGISERSSPSPASDSK